MNFLALLGWAPDGETTIMSRDELVERFTLERVGASPATFDYAKLDWMNGQYLRALDVDAYADALVTYLREQGSDWDEARIRAAAPIVQEKMGRLGEFPEFARFLFEDVEPDPALLDAASSPRPQTSSSRVEPWDAATLETALKALCERLEAKPKTVYLPIRVAVTGSRISPGLYESLELLGRDVSLARLRRGAALAAESARGEASASLRDSRRLTIVTDPASLSVRAPGVDSSTGSRAEGLTSGWARRIRDT